MESQNTQNQIRKPSTFQTKPSHKTSSDMGIGVHNSLHVFRRCRRRRREIKDVKVSEKGGCVDGDDEEDREEIERKIEALKRIVPNGESLGVDKLFDETAGYIVSLQYQVKTLKALTSFFEKLEKEKTKFGG